MHTINSHLNMDTINFQEFGKITKVEVLRNDKGMKQNTAWLQFAEKSSVDAVINSDKKNDKLMGQL